jgi:phosphatidylserine/phosphatidylglycerophosphate/cardiolipin synthase-like enzyme
MKRSARFAVFAAALLLLSLACSPLQQQTLQGPVHLVVAPDDGSHSLLALLRRADHSIDVVVYLLSSPLVVEELAAARQRGVQVRVLLEEKPVGGGEYNLRALRDLRAAGVMVRWSDPAFRFTHAKVVIVDNAWAAIMTLNLTASSFESNRDFAVIVQDAAVVRALGRLFQSDWERLPHAGVELPLVVSPLNARGALLDLIRNARHSLDIYVLSLEDDSIAAALAAAAGRGVRVRLITNPPSERDPYGDERLLLRQHGGLAGFLNYPNIHAKVVIVDGQRAFVGSQNFTATSLDLNREVGLFIDEPDVIQRLQRTFEADWSQVALERSAAWIVVPAA